MSDSTSAPASTPESTPESPVESVRELLTLDELTNRVGMSVRNIRFYTTKGLVPPPIRRGRSGYYSPDHVARLELVQELQSHGFTLSAIEKYMAGIPTDASPEDIALHRTMLAPWQADLPVEMSRRQLEERAGRSLADDDVSTLVALGIVRTRGSRYLVARSQLALGVRLLELGFPREVAEAARALYQEHGRQMAEQLHDLVAHQLAPLYGEELAGDGLAEVLERLKPLAVGGLVTAYEAAITRAAPVPILAIGGLNAIRAAEVMAAGAIGIAVMGGIMRAPDPGQETRALIASVNGARRDRV